MVFGSEGVYLIVGPVSHTYADHLIAVKKKLSFVWRLEVVGIFRILFSLDAGICSIEVVAGQTLAVYVIKLTSFLRFMLRKTR